MKKVTPINRALRSSEDTADSAAREGRASRNRSHNPGGAARRRSDRSTASPRQPSAETLQATSPTSREELRGLFTDYHAREQAQQFRYLEERFNDAIGELQARVSSQEMQIQSLQSTLDSERRLSQSAIANLKDLFDGNYRVMSDISDKYEDSHEAFQSDKAGFDRRLDFIQQESQENNSQLRAAIIQSQNDDRTQLADSLRALADSIDRKPK